jgi:hypothetical protein
MTSAKWVTYKTDGLGTPVSEPAKPPRQLAGSFLSRAPLPNTGLEQGDFGGRIIRIATWTSVPGAS